MLTQSHLYQEIHSQPAVLENLLRVERANIQRIGATLKQKHITNVFIAARGTSDNAGRYAQYLLGAINRLPVGLATPSLYSIYKQPPVFHDALVIGISQSGASPDIVSVLAAASQQGAVTLALTNEPASPLAQAAQYVIPLHAGAEKSVAATKTYTTQLMALALLSAALADDATMFDALNQVPAHMTRLLEMNDAIARAAERYRYMRVCVVIGRGYNYATAFEMALKIKELTYVLAEPYSSADFMHGPVALVEEAFPTIVVAPSGLMREEMRGFIHTLQARGAEVIVLSDADDLVALARTPLRLPVHVPEWLSPLTTIVPGQLFAMHLANARDYDVDHPRGLRKVTETR
ncbi:MAG: glucosamine--fructose-6-phosphate aminotransferase [Chloroflexi bacterium]|nr:MAG: glucosamine--fructose-6-phosphate aminotransferase [Chloroflexota bacterium]